MDNATQNNVAAKAQVQAAKAQIETARAQIQGANAAVQAVTATVETAKLNLGFTRLTSPIDGIAGMAQQQVGALVSPASGPVTTVSTVDPIKVYFTASEQEYLDFHRRYSTPATLDAERKGLRLELILADGTVYPHNGSFYFADRQVNQGTGAIRVAGLFPNPGNLLRPGQYGRVRTSTRTKEGALLIPQRAVTELQGTYQVAVVDSENKIAIRNVKTSDRVGNQWIIDEGLKPGERVVAEGVQKVRPGMAVNPEALRGAGGNGRKVTPMSKFFINRPIVAMVISIPDGDRGRGHHRGTARRSVSSHCSAGSADLRRLHGRGRADHRAVRCHSHRTADERRGQHELHVLAERHGQGRDANDRGFRREDGSEHRSDPRPNALPRWPHRSFRRKSTLTASRCRRR